VSALVSSARTAQSIGHNPVFLKALAANFKTFFACEMERRDLPAFSKPPICRQSL
jgi:hypothetical protein